MRIKRTASVQIDASREHVWHAIAYLDRLCELGLPGFYHRIDIKDVRSGQTFECHDMSGDTYERTIVEWVPYHILSIGNPGLAGWEHEFVVTTFNRQTKLEYSRQFDGNAAGLLANKLFGCNYQQIVDDVAEKARIMIPQWEGEHV